MLQSASKVALFVTIVSLVYFGVLSGERTALTQEKALSTKKEKAASLDPMLFQSPSIEYRPIDCWWWDNAPLSEERLKWQLEDMHAKGVGGTWLYPRFAASQPQSCEPGYFTDGWWKYVDMVLTDHKRLGMQQWANDWLGRMSKNFFQNQLLAMRDKDPRLIGHRLAFHREVSKNGAAINLTITNDQKVISAAAYKLAKDSNDIYDIQSRIDLLGKFKGNQLSWSPTEAGWTVMVVADEPSSLDYISPFVAQKWIEIFFEHYSRNLKGHLGKSLMAYGPDERQVLNGNFLYNEALRQRIIKKKGYDPTLNLAALFTDLGPTTDKLRCDYHETMVDLVEENLYEPIYRWLHDHGMKQATIATWGRKNIRGQTFNYGDFFRMMKHFDITGNEDSVQSGASAFIDTKLSSSIAHLNGHRRVAVCAYWGTGWGFTQEQNIARTNINFALGVNLLNTHGGLYSLMGSRNEFVPPEVHFYQPYWQTWRTFYDSVTRLSYVLSQGEHRADVAILYPISTLHANWNGQGKENKAFDSPAASAERTMFALGETIYQNGIDFDFIDESSVGKAKVKDGKLCPPELEFSILMLPNMSTIRTEVAVRIKEFVKAGGTLMIWGDPPTSSAEVGRNDSALVKLWAEILGDYRSQRSSTIEKSYGNGRAIIVHAKDAAPFTDLIKKSITPDVQCSAPDVIYTHNQVGNQQVYYFVNKKTEAREIEITVRAKGTPQIWDSHTGDIHPLNRYETLKSGTKIRCAFGPSQHLLLVIQPTLGGPQVVSDNLKSIDSVTSMKEGFEVRGTAKPGQESTVNLIYDGRSFLGKAAASPNIAPVKLDGAWECEYAPTMDNRWGDFRYPASKEFLGPEAPVLKYFAKANEKATPVNWQAANFDDHGWKSVKCNYGPYWQQLGPFEKQHDSAQLQKQIIDSDFKSLPQPILGGKKINWTINSYSRKHGADRMDIHQQPADDGLGASSPDFLVLNRLEKESVGYLATQIHSDEQKEMYLHFGNVQDSNLVRQAWFNGERVSGVSSKNSSPIEKVTVKKGWNRIVLRIELPVLNRKGERVTHGIPPLPGPGNRVQTYAVLLNSPTLLEEERYLPWMRWAKSPAITNFDCLHEDQQSVGLYRFTTPPGTTGAKLNLNADSVEGWIDGEKATITDGVLQFPNAAKHNTGQSIVALRVKHKRGAYEGAAFEIPIQFATRRGTITPGDWSKHGLEYYSGGLNYIKKVSLTAEQLKHRVMLDLGDCRTSAQVFVNGMLVDTRLARPFVFDISEFAKAGENEIQVKVLNTLANFMSSQPTRYVFEGQTVSGLLGPVTLNFDRKVSIFCEPSKN